MSQEQKKVKATEKLGMLEKNYVFLSRRLGEMELIMYNLSRENDLLKDTLSLLHQKLNAVIDLSVEGMEITLNNIEEKIVQNHVLQMQKETEKSLADGRIEATEEISDKSFVVTREVNDKGEVVNPRLQFFVDRLTEDSKQKFLGKKVGDLVKLKEDKLGIEIAEIYNIVEQKLEESIADKLEDLTEEVVEETINKSDQEDSVLQD